MPSPRTATTTTAGWSSKLLLPVTLLLAASASRVVRAKYTCDTSLGTYYPYCVNVPDNIKDGEKMPTILFLSGSGARGDASHVKSLSGYDGFGKRINNYLSGNKGADETMAAEQFITIIPISPKNVGGQEIRHWWPDDLDKVLDKVKSEYPVDEDQIHCSGYSMGSRGCWRYATNRPGVLASASPSAGAAESKGDGTLSQQYAEPTFDLLDKITTLPIRQFDGTYDTTAGTAGPKKTQNQLVSLGSSLSALHELSTDHSGLSTQPFNTDLMNWMLKQKRSGSSSSDNSGDGSESTPSTTAKVSSTRVSVDNPKATSTSTSSSSTSSGTKCKRSTKKSKRAASARNNKKRNGAGGLTLAKMLANNAKKEKRGLTLDAMLAGRSASAQPVVARSEQNNDSANPSKRHVNANVARAHPGHQARMMGRRLSR